MIECSDFPATLGRGQDFIVSNCRIYVARIQSETLVQPDLRSHFLLYLISPLPRSISSKGTTDGAEELVKFPGNTEN